MSLKHLRTLVAISEHRTFSDAAASIHLTHAAVSQHMNALEMDVGVPLFDRTGRTPRLTATGRALVEKAKVLLQDYDNLIPSVLDDGTPVGEFKLGMVPTTLTGLAPSAIRNLQRACPNFRLRIRPGLTGSLVTAIDRHELDAAVATRPILRSPRLAFDPIGREPLRLIASQETEENDPMALLKSQPFIRFNRGAVVGTQIETWIQEQGIVVNEVMELENLDAISSMVYANLGVSIVPQTLVRPINPLPLRWLDLGETMPTRELGLIYPKDTPRTGAVREVLRAIREALPPDEL